MTYPGDPSGYSQPNQSGWQQPGNYPPQPQYQPVPDPYAQQPYSAQPYSAQPYSAQPYSPPYGGEYGAPQPAYPPPGPGYGPPPGPGYGPQPGPGYGPQPGPGYGPPGPAGYGPPPARRGGGSTGLILGLLAGGLVLVLFCIGGVFLVTRSNDPSVSATATVDSFLTALFTTKDVDAAMGRVCTERRSSVQVKLDSTNQPGGTAGAGDIQVVVTWKDLRETVRGDNAIVSASANIKVTGGSSGYNPNLVAFWIFTLKADGDEWKVCGWS